MSEPAFAALLDWLGRDGAEAGPSFASLRQRLVRLFAFWGSSGAEEAADETLARVASRLAGGESIRAESRFAYLRGVARFVFLEELRKRGREQTALRQLAESGSEPQGPQEPNSVADPRSACLDKCLAALDPDTRDLVVSYYQGHERERIERREQLAARLRIGVGPLRSRMLRIRDRLRTCLEQCLSDTNRSERPLVDVRRRS
jgi:DNA-directed RNA polymerase specialized sigma24 family protein